jgi:hypothetical protein
MALDALAAVAVLILQTLPVRRRTLATARVEDIVLPPRPGVRGTIYFPGTSMKQHEPASAGLAPWKVELLRLYLLSYRPVLLGEGEDAGHLFPGRLPGEPLSRARFAANVVAGIWRATGERLNVHRWRKLMGGALYRATQDERLVRGLLTHSPNSRAIEHYVRLDRPRIAAERLDAVFEKLLADALGEGEVR